MITIGSLAFVHYGTCVATCRVSYVVTRGQDAGRIIKLHDTDSSPTRNWWPIEARQCANGEWWADGKRVTF